MTKIGFWDVDTQADFMIAGGALYVPGAEKIIPNLEKLYAAAKKHGLTVVATADAHRPDDPELKTWPPHCMVGTPGQKKIRETVQKGQILIEKNENDAFSNPESAATVRRSRIRDWTVFGVATDYCVKCAVLGLLGLGCRVTVVSDAVQGVKDDTSRQAILEMQKAGARFRTTAAVLEGLAPKRKPQATKA